MAPEAATSTEAPKGEATPVPRPATETDDGYPACFEASQECIDASLSSLAAEVSFLLSLRPSPPPEDWGLQPLDFLAHALQRLSPRHWPRVEAKWREGCAKWAAATAPRPHPTEMTMK